MNRSSATCSHQKLKYSTANTFGTRLELSYKDLLNKILPISNPWGHLLLIAFPKFRLIDIKCITYRHVVLGKSSRLWVPCGISPNELKSALVYRASKPSSRIVRINWLARCYRLWNETWRKQNCREFCNLTNLYFRIYRQILINKGSSHVVAYVLWFIENTRNQKDHRFGILTTQALIAV